MLAGFYMSGCECKPDAKRKRDSAQPQDRAQPVKNEKKKGREVFILKIGSRPAA
jgi:hypothetical protein